MHRFIAIPILGAVFTFIGCGDDDSAPGSGGTGGGQSSCAGFSCPATEQSEATCWQNEVACSTVTVCSGTHTVACPVEGQTVDCEVGACLTCPPVDPEDPPLRRCLAEHCCLVVARCAADPGCLPCLTGAMCTGDNAAMSAYTGCIAEHCSPPPP